MCRAVPCRAVPCHAVPYRAVQCRAGPDRTGQDVLLSVSWNTVGVLMDIYCKQKTPRAYCGPIYAGVTANSCSNNPHNSESWVEQFGDFNL